MGMDSDIRRIVREAVVQAQGEGGRQKEGPAAPEDNSLWDVVDVAGFLKASRSWVYQKAESGLLPCLHVGGLLRFDPVAVRAWARGEELVTKRSARGG
jgi:helix-turn-helix protein